MHYEGYGVSSSERKSKSPMTDSISNERFDVLQTDRQEKIVPPDEQDGDDDLRLRTIVRRTQDELSRVLTENERYRSVVRSLNDLLQMQNKSSTRRRSSSASSSSSHSSSFYSPSRRDEVSNIKSRRKTSRKERKLDANSQRKKMKDNGYEARSEDEKINDVEEEKEERLVMMKQIEENEEKIRRIKEQRKIAAERSEMERFKLLTLNMRALSLSQRRLKSSVDDQELMRKAEQIIASVERARRKSPATALSQDSESRPESDQYSRNVFPPLIATAMPSKINVLPQIVGPLPRLTDPAFSEPTSLAQTVADPGLSESLSQSLEKFGKYCVLCRTEYHNADEPCRIHTGRIRGDRYSCCNNANHYAAGCLRVNHLYVTHLTGTGSGSLTVTGVGGDGVGARSDVGAGRPVFTDGVRIFECQAPPLSNSAKHTT